MYQEHE
jgi:hypothetical protein